MSKKNSAIEISEILGIDEPVSTGGTITKEWILEMASELPVPIDSPDLMGKQDLLRHIITELGETWDKSCESEGSTITSIPILKVLHWVQKNIELPRLIAEQKDEILQSVQSIYELLPNDFAVTTDWHFEESLFDKFGDNWTWLKSLEPIWKCLNPSNLDIDWSGTGEDIQKNVTVDLGLKDSDLIIEILNQINTHLLISCNHLQHYIEFIEVDEVSKNKAMEQWNELWDVSDDESEIIDPIIATTASWTIGTFSKYATENKLDTDPIYQREFVWSNTACQMLINSIMMGIPLPSIILHEVKTPDGSKKFQIIDGKQRLTSILRFNGSLPKARMFMKNKMKLLKNSEGKEEIQNYDDEYLINVILSNKDPVNISDKIVPRFRKWHRNKKFGLISDKDKIAKKEILPFPLRKNEFQDVPALEGLNNLYYHEMRNIEIDILGAKVPVSEVFEDSASDYKIPVIIYDKETKPRQIRRVFNRYNTQGTKLNATEVNNAAFQELTSMRLTLALTRVKPDRGEELLPGLYDSEVKEQSEIIEAFFTACNLSAKRFEWAKLMSVILGLLYLRVDKKANGKFNYLSTAKLIKSFYEFESDDEKITKEKCERVAKTIGSAAKSLHSELLFDLLMNNPKFTSKSGNGKWGQPAAIAMMVGTILCQSAGIDVADSIENDDIIYDAMDSYLQNNEAMGQTQSDLQWKYYAKTITNFCKIFNVTKDNFVDEYSLFSGYNLLKYLSEIPQDVE